MLSLLWVITLVGTGVFFGLPVLLLVSGVMLVRARRGGGLSPAAVRASLWLAGISLLAFLLLCLGSGLHLMSAAWLALAAFVVAAVLCGDLLRKPLASPIRVITWAFLADLLLLIAFVPFAVWLANKALRITEYSNPDERAVRAALAKNSNDAAAHSSLAQIEMMRGDYTGEIAEWRQVLRLEPDNEDALFLLGARLTHESRQDEARPLFQKLAAGHGAYAASARRWLTKYHGR